MPKISVYRSADAFIYLPLWLARDAGLFDFALQQDAGASGWEFVDAVEPSGTDLVCVHSVAGDQSPAIGICDATPIFQEGISSDVKLIGTMIRHPSFWLAGFNVPKNPDGTPDLTKLRKLIYFQKNLNPGHNIGEIVAREAGLHFSAVSHATINAENDLRALIECYNANPAEPVAVITPDIEGLARLHCALHGSPVDFSSQLHSYSGDPRFNTMMMTGIIANTAAVAEAKQALAAFMSGLQHSAIIINASKDYSERLVAYIVERQLPERTSATYKSWPPIASSSGPISIKNGPLSSDEAAFIAYAVREGRLYKFDLAPDWSRWRVSAQSRLTQSEFVNRSWVDARCSQGHFEAASTLTLAAHTPSMADQIKSAAYLPRMLFMALLPLAAIADFVVLTLLRQSHNIYLMRDAVDALWAWPLWGSSFVIVAALSSIAAACLGLYLLHGPVFWLTSKVIYYYKRRPVAVAAVTIVAMLLAVFVQMIWPTAIGQKVTNFVTLGTALSSAVNILQFINEHRLKGSSSRAMWNDFVRQLRQLWKRRGD